MLPYRHPRDLPPDWFARWEERAAIMHEGCKLPATEDGKREANQRAFRDILRQMELEGVT